MQCERCMANIEEGEDRNHHGRIVCEDCYMDLLSPAKMCDPWAVHSAKSFPETQTTQLSDMQQKIIDLLKENGPTEPGIIIERLGVNPLDLEREIVPLRHMEKVRARLLDGKRCLMLW